MKSNRSCIHLQWRNIVKLRLFIVIATTLFVQSLFAANQNCAKLAGETALKVANPKGNSPNSSVYTSVSGVRLFKKIGSSLYYRVDISFDINDGYSDSFPPEVYTVLATGDERNCRISGVKLVK